MCFKAHHHIKLIQTANLMLCIISISGEENEVK